MATVVECNSTEHVHRLFRGAAELTKVLKIAALLTEIVAALVAAWRAFDPTVEWSPWATFWLTAIVVGGVLLRVRARYVYSFAEKCRRVASEAYAYDRLVPAVVCWSLDADAPRLSRWLAKRLPTQTLNDYYESEAVPGPTRFRDIYAHSSYYSWRLLQIASEVYFWVTLGFAAIGALAIYSIAASPPDPQISGRILDVVCSVLFAVFVVRAGDAWFSAWASARECKSIAVELSGAITSDRLRTLAIDYDVERSSGPTVPTLVYLRWRDELQRAWHRQRAELGAVTQGDRI